MSLSQSEVMCSTTVELIGSLLQQQAKYPVLKPHLSNLQLQISKKLSELLEGKEDEKVRDIFSLLFQIYYF